MTEKGRMLKGLLYKASDNELSRLHQQAQQELNEFNDPKNYSNRMLIIKNLFGRVGSNCYIEPPLRMDYGFNTYIGDNFYANFELIILDVAPVKIGSNVFIGPRVSIFTAGHPITSSIRNTGLEFGKPVEIGSSVWIGGNTTINPGVKIGNNVVIGSGSVVTKDIPNDVIAAGNPCHIIRKISLTDQTYWQNLANEYYKDKE